MNICRIRKNNSIKLRKQISSVALNQNIFFSEIDEGPAPYRFVLRCNNLKEAEYLFEKIRASGLPVESWPDLPAEVVSNPQEYEIARKLRDTLVFLPVHQSYQRGDLNFSE